jgi:hypothetical protein
MSGCNSQPNTADTAFKGLEPFFEVPESYVAAYAGNPPVIDGAIDDEAWSLAAWTNEFRDIEGSSVPTAPSYATRAKMLWDEEYLYIAAYLEDKHVWAKLTERDQIIYADNDFEVFIDPSGTAHNYYEFEVNAFNTMFDLFLTKPYRSGSHILISWDCKGLKHAVQISGTLNHSSDEDQGWTVEMAIPFRSIAHTPKDGELWRLDFSRVQWDTHVSEDGEYIKQTDAKGNTLPEHNWVWSPTGAINMHMPERWGYVQFSSLGAGADLPAFELPYDERQSRYLWLIFYRQQEYFRRHGTYAFSLDKLSIPVDVSVDGKANTLTLSATPQQFTATVSDASGPSLRISHEGSLRKLR